MKFRCSTWHCLAYCMFLDVRTALRMAETCYMLIFMCHGVIVLSLSLLIVSRSSAKCLNVHEVQPLPYCHSFEYILHEQ